MTRMDTFLLLAGVVFAGALAHSNAAAANYTTLYDLLSSTPELSESLKLINYTGLLPLTQNPNTTITCFLPSNKYLKAQDVLDGWEAGSPDWNPQPGRYIWAILLHHCLDGNIALTPLANLTAKTYNYKSAFVWRFAFTGLATASVQIKVKAGGPITFIDEQWQSANVIKADLRGGKSVIHIIDNGDQIPIFAPPDSFYTLADFADWKAPAFKQLLEKSSLADVLAAPTTPFTAFAPSDAAIASLLKSLKVNMTTLLAKKAVVDLLVRAHIVNGSALWTGAFIRYPGFQKITTLAGPVNVTTDLAIFPNRSGSAKFISLSTAITSGALLADSDVGGNSNDEKPPVAPWVVHSVSKVLLPASTKSIAAMLTAP